MTKITFKETQRFDQWWLKALLALVLLSALIPVILIAKQPDSVLLDFVAASVGFIIVLAVSVFIFTLQLKTQITYNGIEYQFSPFKKKHIPWKEIEECYVRDYKPIKEYGGWGFRMGPNGKALNTKGTKGIQIVLLNGKNILLGTQKENEAKSVIETYFTLNTTITS